MARATTGTTVTVACKLPNGLNLGKLHGADQPDVILRGTNHHLAVGGYGLTHGVDADAFAKWLKDHSFMHAVKNNLIFAHEKPAGARAMAGEMADVKSGLEPLNGDNPGLDDRVAGEQDVEPTDDQKKANDKAKAEREETLEELRTMEPDEA